MTTVCQLVHSLSIGGAEVLAARIGRRLVGRFRFVYACLEELGPLGDELRNDGFPVHQLGRGAGIDYRCAQNLRRLLRSERVDIIHAHQFTPYFYATLARAPFRKPAVLFTEHGRFHPDYPRRKRMLYNKLAVNRRDGIVAVGKAVRQALIDNEGFPAGRVDVIYNGINLEPYRRDEKNRGTDIREEFGIPASAFLVAHVARLDPIKDHRTSMQAVARLVRAGVDARLLIVGDGPERAAIEQARQELAPDHIILSGARRDIPAILAAANAFLLTSLSEGIPLTIIEAMAAGLPVVSTDVGGIAEVVVPEKTGLLAPSGDAPVLAEHLERLSRKPQLAEELGAAGRALAEENFSEDAMINAYAARYLTMTPAAYRTAAR